MNTTPGRASTLNTTKTLDQAQPQPNGRRAAVLGSPISHSLSPALHRAAYDAAGLTGWTYEAHDIDEAGLAGFLAGLEADWIGLSLTRPLKQVALELVDHLAPLAQTVGSVNTILFTPAGLVGANTDVYGIIAAIQETAGMLRQYAGATILGGGATAASALAALGQLGLTTPRVVVRSMARSRPVTAAAARMGIVPAYAKWPTTPDTISDIVGDVVVATAPAHAADQLASWLRLADLDLTGKVLLDAAYAPWPSALAAAWSQAGGVTASGRLMLLHQATEQFRLMTGMAAPIAAMRQAIDLPPVT